MQRKGVGTLTYYLVVALLLLRVLDCHTVYNKQSPHQDSISLPMKGKYITKVWAFLLIIHTVELSRFQQGITLAKRPFVLYVLSNSQCVRSLKLLQN